MNFDTNQFTETLINELEKYTNEVSLIINDAVEKTTANLVINLKNDSPKQTGKYSKSWTKKKDKSGKYIVYNKLYQLTHILEHGFTARNGERVQGKPHIKPNEERAINELMRRVEGDLK